MWFGTVESMLYAAIIQGGIQTLVLLVYLNFRFPGFWLKFNAKFFREHLVYAVPFGAAGILWTLQNDMHYYFVSNTFGEAMFAIYAIGCFQLPLITMLAESVTSVLIPRMSQLQLVDDRNEMVRVTVGAMQKLSFFYFPAYVFLFITAETFITTLFTDKFTESVPVFLIFLTFLPFHIMLADPIVRAYEDLGRFLLKLRIATFITLFTALYFGVQYFGLKGIIGTVVVIRIAEMLIAESVVFHRIGVRLQDFRLLKNIGKTALISLFAGVFTFAVYYYVKEFTPSIGEYLVRIFFAQPGTGIVNFVSGSLTLGITFGVYASIYLLAAYFWNIIDSGEKETIINLFNKLLNPFNKRREIQTPQSQTLD
ncbi:MAG: oligosaccharide flippase family protein [Acidobacteriota bacterium]|nr:oligosaccharide flippase family protein [Acidobacteriota bacterium]